MEANVERRIKRVVAWREDVDHGEMQLANLRTSFRAFEYSIRSNQSWTADWVKGRSIGQRFCNILQILRHKNVGERIEC